MICCSEAVIKEVRVSANLENECHIGHDVKVALEEDDSSGGEGRVIALRHDGGSFSL